MADDSLLFPLPEMNVPMKSGNPVAAPAAKRERLTKTYFNNEEYATVAEKALACGKTVSVYMRETALGQEIKVRKLRHRDAVIRELSLVGTELRHIREQHADISPEMSAKLNTALDTILDLLTRASKIV